MRHRITGRNHVADAFDNPHPVQVQQDMLSEGSVKLIVLGNLGEGVGQWSRVARIIDQPVCLQAEPAVHRHGSAVFVGLGGIGAALGGEPFGEDRRFQAGKIAPMRSDDCQQLAQIDLRRRELAAEGDVARCLAHRPWPSARAVLEQIRGRAGCGRAE